MSEPKKSRLVARLLIASVLLVTLSALALMGLFIASVRRPAGPINIALRNSLVGTWAGENGVVLEFRADGTATSRSKKSVRAPQYFDWAVSGSELAIFDRSDHPSIGWTINRYVLARPNDTYEVQQTTLDQFELLGKVRGDRLRFKKLKDSEPEIAP